MAHKRIKEMQTKKRRKIRTLTFILFPWQFKNGHF